MALILFFLGVEKIYANDDHRSFFLEVFDCRAALLSEWVGDFECLVNLFHKGQSDHLVSNLVFVYEKIGTTFYSKLERAPLKRVVSAALLFSDDFVWRMENAGSWNEKEKVLREALIAVENLYKEEKKRGCEEPILSSLLLLAICVSLEGPFSFNRIQAEKRFYKRLLAEAYQTDVFKMLERWYEANNKGSVLRARFSFKADKSR
jgi:hypothetical protein